jgi:transposase InsO family protein/predicted transcriptional regulator
MSNWYTLQELIKFDLIGLPSTVAGLRKKAQKEDWECRAREGRGGGWEYSVESLPRDSQAALVAKLQPAIEEQPITVGHGIDQRKAWANLQILDAFGRFEADYGCNALREELELNFCKLYNQRELTTVSSECWAIVPQISRSTLCKRRREYQLQGLDALGRNSRRIGAIESYPGLQEAIEVCIAAGRGRWSPRQVKLALEKSFEDLPFIPSEHQLRRWLNKFEVEQKPKLIQYRSEKESKNKLMPAFGTYSAHLTVPNEIWELDDTKQDLILEFEEDGEAKEKRFALVGAIDVYTRRRKFQIYETANSEAVLLLLRRCLLDWGKPIAVKTDNGKNYVSGRTELFLRALQIGVERCDPYSPQQKPHIERLFRTLQHGEFEMLPGYCGHSVAERQDIRDEKDPYRLRMSPEAFQAWIDKWCEKAHLSASEGLDGMSPIEVLASSIRKGWHPRSIADERALDFLILPVATRKVQKSGIQVNNRYYVAGELGKLVGQEVHVRWHPENPNDIYVYSNDSLDKFVCVARWLNPMSAEQQKQVAAAGKATYKQAQADVKEKQKQAKALKRVIENDPVGLVKMSKEGNVNLNIPREAPKKIFDPMAAIPAPQMDAADQEEMLLRQERLQARLSQQADMTEEQQFQVKIDRARALYERCGDLSEEERQFLARFERISPNLAKNFKARAQAVAR